MSDKDLLINVRDMLRRCRSDIFQTARVNQCNLNGVDIVCPTDAPCVSRIGRHFVHQEGVNESLRLCADIDSLVSELSKHMDTETKHEVK